MGLVLIVRVKRCFKLLCILWIWVKFRVLFDFIWGICMSCTILISCWWGVMISIRMVCRIWWLEFLIIFIRFRMRLINKVWFFFFWGFGWWVF